MEWIVEMLSRSGAFYKHVRRESQGSSTLQSMQMTSYTEFSQLETQMHPVVIWSLHVWPVS